MAVSSKDIEKLWKEYSEDAANRGISVAHFFESNGVPYHVFEKWYKKKFSIPEVVNCVVAGLPADMSDTCQPSEEESPVGRKKESPCVSYITIGFSDGMKIEHHRLSYGDLLRFIQKLQPLCSA